MICLGFWVLWWWDTNQNIHIYGMLLLSVTTMYYSNFPPDKKVLLLFFSFFLCLFPALTSFQDTNEGSDRNSYDSVEMNLLDEEKNEEEFGERDTGMIPCE